MTSSPDPPRLVAISPAVWAENVAPDANIVLTFDRPVTPSASRGFDPIVFWAYDDFSQSVSDVIIDFNDPDQVSFSGNTITINPGADLLGGKRYVVDIPPSELKDLAGNLFPFAGDAEFSFTTAYTAVPNLLHISSQDHAANVPVAPSIVLTFDQPIQAGTGNIEIHSAADGLLRQSILVGDTNQVVFSQNHLTIQPSANLNTNTDYYVTLASGVIQNVSGTAFSGITSPNELAFKTAPTVFDGRPPLLVTTSPSDGDTDAVSGADIVLNFNEPVRPGVGSILISFDLSTYNIPTDDQSIAFSGDSITIHGGVWGPGDFSIKLPIGVVQDAAGNAFDGASFGFDVPDANPPGGVTIIFPNGPPHAELLGNDVAIDMAAWDASQFENGTIVYGSDTRVDIAGATDGLTYRFVGKFFSSTATSYAEIGGEKDELAVFDDRSGIHHFLYSIENYDSALHAIADNEEELSRLADIFSGGNAITGSSAGERLEGAGSYDTLIGLAGNDTLIGSPGPDVLDGGAGADVLTGGIGVDTFQVSKISDLVAGDEITDLEPGDVIDLSAVAGLSFIGSAAFSGTPGQVNYLWNGGRTILQIDSNGDRIADAFLTLDGGQFVLGETSTGSEKLHIAGGVPSPSLVDVSSAPDYPNGNPTFELLFDQNMEAGSGAIEIHKASDGSLAGTLQLDGRNLHEIGRSVSIDTNLVPGLKDSTPYYVVISPGALRSESGQDFAGISDPSVLTFPGGDTGPPKFLGSSPNANATNVPVDSNIVLTFSEPVKSGGGSIFLQDLTTNQAEIISTDDSSQVTYSGDQVIINPTSDLEASHRYAINVSAGGILDLTGNAFTGSAYDFFETPDLVPPLLLDSSLYNGAVGVNPFLNGISFSFDEAVTAGSGFIEIRKTADGSLVSKIDIADPSEAHFQPGGGYVDIRFAPTLDFGTTYSVTIDTGAIENLSGTPFAGISASDAMTFTTATLDQYPPTPIAFSPANHATAANPAANIVLTFSRDVIPATGDIIIHRASDQSVAARIAITDSSQVQFNGSIVTVNPANDLDRGTAYYITMPFGLVVDHSGNPYLGTSSTPITRSRLMRLPRSMYPTAPVPALR